jgi:hypothetical protein
MLTFASLYGFALPGWKMIDGLLKVILIRFALPILFIFLCDIECPQYLIVSIIDINQFFNAPAN